MILHVTFRVFRNSHLWRNGGEYINTHEYNLVDKGIIKLSFACAIRNIYCRISSHQVLYPTIS